MVVFLFFSFSSLSFYVGTVFILYRDWDIYALLAFS